MAALARLPAALRDLEAAIDAEVDFRVLRAVRQRLNERWLRDGIGVGEEAN